MSRIVRTSAIILLAMGSSSVWAQYGPARGGAANPGRREMPKKEFRFSEDDQLPANPATRSQPRTAGNIVPVAGQTPIRQPGGRQPVGDQPVGDQPGSGEGSIIPCPWRPLAPQAQQALDDLMKAWEKHSSKIERYRCEFERWEYDPIFGPKDPGQPKTYGKGKLLYASPDKGLFKVESLNVWAPPAKPEEEAKWLKRPAEDIGEHWVCDGKRIFEFDARQKKLLERELPPEMHGKAIVDGPLPFLFGAKAAKINARYWLRLITPDDVQGEQWIEAVPKQASDARNFKMVHVIIDEKDFLPKAIQVFDPAFHPEKRAIRSVYTFNGREYNWDITLQMLNLFHREFYEPKTPFGWTKVVEPFFPEPGQQPPAGKTPTAQKPNPLKLPFRFR